MTNYNLENINDKEFELLARDILQKELGLKLESFKKGRDGGIDLRYSKPNMNNDIIVQAKHWFHSNFEKLYNELITVELPKLKKLKPKPKRYIIITSIGLLPQHKEKIQKAFKPYITQTGDVWGKDDINNRLNLYKDIAFDHYKLWLTSSAVLLQILNNGIKSRTNFVLDEIKKNIRLFVPTKSYSDSLSVLKKEKFLILSGEPGIGKTTLANHLIFGFLARDYELFFATDVKDFENVYEIDKKQIFYFDDFLGANYLDIINPQNNDSLIINFINRISKSDNKLLILTTRTTILNRAMQISGKFQQANLDLKKYEIKIQDYSKYDRAKILYNHITFTGLKDEYKERIIENKNYLLIISHKNYNPRIIEYITSQNNLKETKPNEYLEYIIEKLNNPQMIWKDPYENQLDDYARFMVTTLFSVGYIGENKFKEAYLNRLQYEINKNGFNLINNPYNSKLRELLGSFITRTYNGQSYHCNFFNPSIIDFLINYLNESTDEFWRIIESAIFVEQLTIRFSLVDENLVVIPQKEVSKFYDSIRKIEHQLKSIYDRNRILTLINLYSTFPNETVKEDIPRLYRQLNLDDIRRYYDFAAFATALINCSNFLETRRIILEKWEDTIFKLFSIATEVEEFYRIKEIFAVYNYDYDDFACKDENKVEIQQYIDDFWFSEIDAVIESLKDENIQDLSDLKTDIDYKIDEIREFNNEFNLEESPSFEDLMTWDYEDWYKELERSRRDEEREDEYYYNEMMTQPFANNYKMPSAESNNSTLQRIISETPLTEDQQIDDLFSQ